jgi:hypothetical protein
MEHKDDDEVSELEEEAQEVAEVEMDTKSPKTPGSSGAKKARVNSDAVEGPVTRSKGSLSSTPTGLGLAVSPRGSGSLIPPGVKEPEDASGADTLTLHGNDDEGLDLLPKELLALTPSKNSLSSFIRLIITLLFPCSFLCFSGACYSHSTIGEALKRYDHGVHEPILDRSIFCAGVYYGFRHLFPRPSSDL